MLLRKFDEEEVKHAFPTVHKILSTLQTTKDYDFSSILIDDTHTVRISPDIDLDTEKIFASRKDIAAYLYDKLKPLSISSIIGDAALWTWLALALHRNLMKTNKDGSLKYGSIGKDHRWILQEDDYLTRYRHLLAGPFKIYATFFEKGNLHMANALLCQPVHTPGEVNEQIYSSQEFVQNQEITYAATQLYYDNINKRLKKNASGKSQGSPRHFSRFLRQLALTRDLSSLDSKLIISLLPIEFNKFKE